ncbi:hypothetical protein [Pseudomonas sp. 1 R 17]|uniref:hypothetical protein n=1 Tax=Pseudomonas sp. 1 R 17 TaxID=1844091 RepID=UPI000811E8B5|nr:hypothetical protein [Pseudomonas sp. 1 R 17]SAM35799.1 hypothetical protein BN1864_LIB5394:05846 [Pseudomonas sp. 1 R 17]
MRNVKTREGMEYWDKICSLKHYGFLHSPDGKRVVKTEGIGNWIDKFQAQEIVDQAQDEINQYRAERDALQVLLTAADQRNDTATSLIRRIVANFDTEIECNEDVEPNDLEHDQVLSDMRAFLNPKRDDWLMNPCGQGHRDVGAAGGVAQCYTCDEKITAASTQEAFEQWNATHPAT